MSRSGDWVGDGMSAGDGLGLRSERREDEDRLLEGRSSPRSHGLSHMHRTLSFTRTGSLTGGAGGGGGGVGTYTAAVSRHVNSQQCLLAFVASHRSVLNLLVQARPQLLDSSFACMIRITQLRTHLMFENKQKYFFAQLKRHTLYSPPSRRGLHLQVRRNQVFEDTFQQLRSKSAEELRGRLQITFYDEEGVDAGGLTREWFSIISREIFNPDYVLFTGAADGATFQPNPLSGVNSNHLEYFKFVGRIIGKAIYDGQLMDAHFTRSFYKHLLGMAVEFGDLESTEPDYYKV